MTKRQQIVVGLAILCGIFLVAVYSIYTAPLDEKEIYTSEHPYSILTIMRVRPNNEIFMLENSDGIFEIWIWFDNTLKVRTIQVTSGR